MKKYQIVTKWNTESALQILEIDSIPKNNFTFVKFLFVLIIIMCGYGIFGGGRSSVSHQEKKELVIPAPILNMKSNPHAAEDLNTLGDL